MSARRQTMGELQASGAEPQRRWMVVLGPPGEYRRYLGDPARRGVPFCSSERELMDELAGFFGGRVIDVEEWFAHQMRRLRELQAGPQ